MFTSSAISNHRIIILKSSPQIFYIIPGGSFVKKLKCTCTGLFISCNKKKNLQGMNFLPLRARAYNRLIYNVDIPADQ